MEEAMVPSFSAERHREEAERCFDERHFEAWAPQIGL
jgi:hypothetical protein